MARFCSRRNRGVRQHAREFLVRADQGGELRDLTANTIGLAALLGNVEESERVLARDGAGGHG